jgi:hypothetical protein
MPVMVTVKESASPAGEAGLLDIVVPYTTPRLTRLALREAEALASKLPSRIRVLRMLAVPFPLDLRYPPFSLDILREQTRQVARGIAAAEILLFLTRNPEQSLLRNMRAGSIVVIASEKRWWRTEEERLERICARRGHQVALVYSR